MRSEIIIVILVYFVVFLISCGVHECFHVCLLYLRGGTLVDVKLLDGWNLISLYTDIKVDALWMGVEEGVAYAIQFVFAYKVSGYYIRKLIKEKEVIN